MPDDFDEAIKALAHPMRRQILQWLKDPQANFPEQHHSLDDGVCAGQIHQKSELSGSTASAHLAVLHKAGLVHRKKVGQWHFFSRNEQAITALLSDIRNQI
ncbi:MAG TPA: metalloregulator ArsR/SmtB family transcription factor [Marinagarivorans sp.]